MIRAGIVVLLMATPSMAALTVSTDPLGDVTFAGADVGEAQRWNHADLVSLSIDERADAFLLTLNAAAQADPSRTIADEVEYTIAFRFGTYAFEVRVDWSSLSEVFGVFHFASLYRQTGPDRPMAYMQTLEMQSNTASGSGTMIIVVPRGALADESGVEPFAGTALTEVRVNSHGYWDGFFGMPSTVHDRMPDFTNVRYDVELGVQQHGDIRLSTDERIRGSNGQATTYFWRVQVHNFNATFDDEVTLALLDVPETWIARLPLLTAKVPAGETVDVPLLLTVPFAHLHGITDSLVLEARSLRDLESVGRVQLGVEFLDPAQPAGHHDLVYLHATTGRRPMAIAGSFGTAYLNGPVLSMNTLSEDISDDNQPVPGHVDSRSESHTMRAGWVVPLQPALRLGLDFDLQQTGELVLPIETTAAMTDAVLHGYLLQVPKSSLSMQPSEYDGFPGVKILADVGPLDVGSITSDEVLQASIGPRVEADRVPHDPEQTLVLLLWLHANGVPPPTYEQAPTVLPGASMRLPLLEYHDVIDEKFSAPDFLQVALTGSTERFLAPGTALLWDMHVRNGGERELELVATVQGEFSDWVEFPAGTYHTVPTNETTTIPIAIRAPKNADIGDVADVVFEVADLEDPRIRGIVRVVATVAQTSAAGDVIPEDDQSATVDAIQKEHNSKKSPVAVFPLAIALLAAVVARRRLQ